MKKIIFLLALTLSTTQQLFSEIEKITIQWKPETCKNWCGKLISRQLDIIQGVAESTLDEKSGTAVLRWKPKQSFSWNPINSAFRMVGVAPTEAKIKVRGLINHTASEVSLLSLGDNTKFSLLTPAKADTTAQKGQTQQQQVNQVDSIEKNPLSPEMRNQLLETEKKFEVVTIEGTLFEPWKTTGLYILIDSITPSTITTSTASPQTTTAPR